MVEADLGNQPLDADCPEGTTAATEMVLPGKVAPSGLQLVRRALTALEAGQALVRVESSRVDSGVLAETAMRRFRYYGQLAFPFVPGYDLVGVVDAVDPGVDRTLVGRRVAALTKTGRWATAALLAGADLVEVPDGIDPDEAETLIVNGLTAYLYHRFPDGKPAMAAAVLTSLRGAGGHQGPCHPARSNLA
ncbi:MULTISPECIES: alcohol dehydrogenase catalytic domain-containing protein [Streptomyces]|uniref:alcohol dehydrogenase catalytic domain-containing protein n=1 Tax=Streptomyces TaxID=1883 RepID=UPI000ACC2765|nr:MULTISPECIES: alcohol dehydrogenase catalytic domain-containing protein [Streptomyces]MDI5910444.1 hypothetical protein [Streptomyces sp. 12257]